MRICDVSKTGARARAVRVCGSLLICAVILQHQGVVFADVSALSIRALAITAAQLGSVESSRRVLSTAMADGFNTLFVPIPLDGASGAVADSIDAVIREARERGVRVHASIQVLRAANADELPASREHVVYRNPQWLMVPRDLGIEMLSLEPRNPDYIGRLARWTRANGDRADGLYLSVLQPEATDYVANAIKAIVSRFPVDGVHLEALRFPSADFDYNRRAQDAFRSARRPALDAAERARLDDVQAIDPFGYAEELPGEWRRFRSTRLTSLVAQIRTTVRAVRPTALVSASVLAGADRALERHSQDWRTWLDNGFVDALSDESTVTTLLSSYETLIDRAPASASAAETPAAAGSQ